MLNFPEKNRRRFWPWIALMLVGFLLLLFLLSQGERLHAKLLMFRIQRSGDLNVINDSLGILLIHYREIPIDTAFAQRLVDLIETPSRPGEPVRSLVRNQALAYLWWHKEDWEVVADDVSRLLQSEDKEVQQAAKRFFFKWAGQQFRIY